MRRVAVAPRPEWQARLLGHGFDFHTLVTDDGRPDPYWIEDACYEFSTSQIEELEGGDDLLRRADGAFVGPCGPVDAIGKGLGSLEICNGDAEEAEWNGWWRSRPSIHVTVPTRFPRGLLTSATQL